MRRASAISIGLWLSVVWLVACTAVPTLPLLPGTPVATPTALPTVTATPEPLAGRVNGAPILLASYQREIERCRAGLAAAGWADADCPGRVWQRLIEIVIIEQAATEYSVAVSSAEVETEAARIAQALGGPEAYAAWLAANRYTEAEFGQALLDDLMRARLAAAVSAGVGETAEQVRARALLAADEATAERWLAQLRAGADFGELAVAESLDLSSRIAGGDLGWFPRGTLTTPEVEAAAFALQPGETSGIIHSALGFHIVQTLERDPARPLTAQARATLRAQVWQIWLEQQLAGATIEKYVDP